MCNYTQVGIIPIAHWGPHTLDEENYWDSNSCNEEVGGNRVNCMPILDAQDIAEWDIVEECCRKIQSGVESVPKEDPHWHEDPHWWVNNQCHAKIFGNPD